MDLDDSFQNLMYTPKARGNYVLVKEDCGVQCGHTYFQSSKKNTPPGYFVIITGADRFTLYVCGASYLYVLYLENARNMLANALKLEENSIPPSSEFLGHSYIQHAGPGLRGTHDLLPIIYTSSQCKKC